MIEPKFFWNRIENVLTAVRFPKKLQFEYRYKGYVYSHLSGPFVTWLFENLDGIVLPALREIKHFWVGEEFFFQMLIMYSPYGAEAVNASQIYSEWFSPERGMPAFLNADDYPSILASGKPFIRKVSSEKSGDLIRCIFEAESLQ